MHENEGTPPDRHAAEVRRSFALRVLAAAIGLGSTFLVTVMVYRVLPVRESSVFFAILAALAIGPMVGRLGLGPNVIRLLPTATTLTGRRRIATVHLQATLMISAVTAPFVTVVATWAFRGQPGYAAVVVMTLVVVVAESMRLTLSDIFAATGRVRMAVATTHHVRSGIVLPALAVVLLLAHSRSLAVVVGVYTVVSVLQLTIAMTIGRDELARPTLRGLDTLAVPIWHGAKLFMLDLSAFVCLPGTVWLANVVFEAQTAGIYSAAATLALQVTVLESLASLAVTPVIARLWVAGDHDRAVAMLSAVATVGTAVTVAIVAIVAVFGDTLMTWAYGPSMAGGGVILLILSLGGVAKAALGGNVTVLIVSDHVNDAAWTALILLTVMVPVGIVAARFGGPEGLAWASTVAATAIAVAQWLGARRRTDRVPVPRADLRYSLNSFRG
ncbi:lipopolysaccharide biosynthesis protein [Gordonia sp. NPDC003376]